MLSACRTLFFIVIIFVTLFLGTNYNSINISTDLKDLSPTLSNDLNTQQAIDILSKDIESRFILIITNENRQQLQQAYKRLTLRLSEMDNISTATLSSDNILDELKAYQFNLLSPKQRIELQKKSKEQLTEQAKRKLFRMDSTVQLLPFNEDPLGTFNNFINNLLEKSTNSDSGTQSVKDNKKTIYYQTASVRINQGSMQIDKQRTLMSNINSVERELLEEFSTNTLRSGVFFFAADAAEKSETDIKLISTISTMGIIALLLFVFRSFSVLLLPIASILIGVTFAVGINHYVYGSIHILTIVFGASLIGIIIDYSLHYFYHQKFEPTQSNKQENTHKLFRAMLLSLITSLVGYSALSFSSLDALKKVALFSCCGIFAAWLSVITIGSLGRVKNITTSDSLFSFLLHFFNSILKPLARKLSFTLWGVIVLTGSILLYFFGMQANDNPRLFFNPSTELLSQEQQANKFSSNFEPGRYIVIAGSSSEKVYEAYDRLLETVQLRLSSNDDDIFFSAMQLLPSPKQQQQDYLLQSQIYAESGIAENLFSTFGLPAEQVEALRTLYNSKKSVTLSPSVLFNESSGLPPVWLQTENQDIGFVLIKKGVDAELLETVVNENKNTLEDVTFINTLALSEGSLKQQRISASILLFLAYLFIAFIMLAYYRSLKALWILLVPITATLGTLFIFTLLNINITLFNVMGLFLVLGLGMDYVIFIKEMNEHNSITQNAILLSTLTTLLSFGLLSISSIPVAQAFGTTLLIGNTLNFLGSLLYAQLYAKAT